MPATAGRVPMPKGNRVDTSASLRTTGIWANTIGYDPYAPTADAPGGGGPATGKAATQNIYERSKDLMAAARLTGGVEVDASRGLWKGAGRLKGYHAPGRGMPSDVPLVPPAGAAAGAGAPSDANARAADAADDDQDDSDDLSTSSESERRRKHRKEKKRKHKGHKHKHKKRRGSDREDSSGDEDDESGSERRHKRHKHKHRSRHRSASRSR